jgi:hypothetical protein
MNKLIKRCAIGGIALGTLELGKGYILGVLKACDVSATETITLYSGDSSKILRFMAKLANSTADYLKKEDK